MKPWEMASFGAGASYPRMMNSSAPSPQYSLPTGQVRGGIPPLPPRPGSASYGNSYLSSGIGQRSYGYGSYGGYGGNYGGYSGMGYGGYSGMGMGYGGTMYGGGGYGYGMGPENRFIQMAEDSTRSAFQGIESLVRAFGSIAMMFDSTFFAVTNTFRAVLGVAENFGQIRSLFGQLWSSFALFRFINYLYRKVVSLFGVKFAQDLGGDAWNQAMSETGELLPKSQTSSWPILMFLGMVVSAPYLIAKLLPPIIDNRNPSNWKSPGRKVRVQYAFQGRSSEELTVQPGEQILIAPKAVQDSMQLAGSGWVFAVSKNQSNAGLVPINYLQIFTAPRPAPTQIVPPNEGAPSVAPVDEIVQDFLMDEDIPAPPVATQNSDLNVESNETNS